MLVCLVGFATFGVTTFGVSGWAIASPLPESAPSATAESLFSANCAACHANGGNIIRRGKNLKQKALSRYGYDSAENIADLVSQGKGAMPAYADRLSEAEIGAIAQYVLTQAEAGW
ncbi:MAG: c-type cytochrome [Phormidesmis sp.]